MNRLIFSLLILVLILSGCSTPEVRPDIPKSINKINENNLTVNTPEYIAYFYVKNSMGKEYAEAIKLLDNDLKQKYASTLYEYLEQSIKYKYFEPVYDIFGKNITMEQIKQVPVDQMLGSFINVSVRMNFKSPKVELEFLNVKTDSGQSDVQMKGRFFIPAINRWETISSVNVKLKQKNNVWKVVEDSGVLTTHINNQLNSISKCQNKEATKRAGQSYTNALAQLNKETCSKKAQIVKMASLMPLVSLAEFSDKINEEFISYKSSIEENERDKIFHTESCMDFKNSKSYKLTTDIVSDEACKELNITPETVSLPYDKVHPSFEALQNFYLGKGELLCVKSDTSVETVVSKKTGWFDRRINEIGHKDTAYKSEFHLFECRDPK